MASEASDYDEDVILPSSPLSQYMHEFETFKDNFNECDEFPVLKTESFFTSFDFKSKVCYFKQLMLDSFKCYLSFIYNIFVPCFIPFEHTVLKQILEHAKSSKVLITEDLAILLSYESEDESNGELKFSNSSLIQQCFQLFAFVMIFMILRSITITNIVSNEDLLSLFSNKSYFICVLFQVFILIISLALYINVFIITIFIVLNFAELLLCRALCHSVQKKLNTTGCIMVMMRKCIRLIQEAELIARGFTTASVPGIVERLELSAGLPIPSPKRQYPELRRCVFMWTQKMFMLYKSSTQFLIENKKIGPVLDFSSQSFAMLDLKEFGSLLKYDVDYNEDLQELLKLTDGLSVSSLKTMYILLELQVSEFYKYLYLLTSFLISDDSLFSCWRKIDYFYRLNSYVRNLQNEDLSVWKKSCETHKYYKSIEAQSDAETKTLFDRRSDASHFEIDVHNMSLHLKAALKRLADFEDLLELIKKSNESDSQNCMKKVEKLLREVKLEIDAYHDYYEKCYSEIQNILYGKMESPVLSIPAEKSLGGSDTYPTALVKCDSDPVIEDEIFEAIATKEKESDLYDFAMAKQKSDFEVSGKLLHELKNVLVLKADEHRVREEKAMARKRGHTESLPDEVHRGPDSETDSEIAHPLPRLLESSETQSSSMEDEESSSCSCVDEPGLLYSSLKVGSESLNTESSFAASIAALALLRQKNLGISDEICFSDNTGSEEEVLSD